MSTIAATFEGQTTGTGATVANSDDFGDTAFENVTPGSGGTIDYNSGHAWHGGMALRMSQSTSATQAYVRYALDGSDFTSCAFRFYVYLNGLPGTDANFPCRVMTSAGGAVFQVLLRTTGVLRLANTAGSVVASTTAALTTGTWYRIEVQASALNGSSTVLALQVFAGDDASAISGGSISASSVTTSAAGRLLTIGKTSTAAISDWVIDDVAGVSGSNTAIGPSASDTPISGTDSTTLSEGTTGLAAGSSVTDSTTLSEGATGLAAGSSVSDSETLSEGATGLAAGSTVSDSSALSEGATGLALNFAVSDSGALTEVSAEAAIDDGADDATLTEQAVSIVIDRTEPYEDDAGLLDLLDSALSMVSAWEDDAGILDFANVAVDAAIVFNYGILVDL